MFKRRWTIALAVGAAVMRLFPACDSSQKTEPKAVSPELKLERVRFLVWRGEDLRAKGDARVVTIRRDTSHAGAVDLKAELMGQGEPVVITAPSAKGDLATQVFSAQGGVVVVHGLERAETERARYEPGPTGQGLISGDDPVVVERGSLTLEGVGFSFDPERGELELEGPVTTRSAEGRR